MFLDFNRVFDEIDHNILMKWRDVAESHKEIIFSLTLRLFKAERTVARAKGLPLTLEIFEHKLNDHLSGKV